MYEFCKYDSTLGKGANVANQNIEIWNLTWNLKYFEVQDGTRNDVFVLEVYLNWIAGGP